jgi:hypothetical protein
MTRAERRARLERRRAQVRRQYWDWLVEMTTDEQQHWVARRAQMRGSCSCLMCRGHAAGEVRARDRRHWPEVTP